MEAPTITHFIALYPDRHPGDEPCLAMHAQWPDGRFKFLIQSRPGMPDVWRDSHRLWQDIKDGLAPLEVQAVDTATFQSFCVRQGISTPTLQQWWAAREDRARHHIPIVRVSRDAGRDVSGPGLR